MQRSRKNLFFVTLPYRDVSRSVDFLVANNFGVEVAAHDTNWLLNVLKESAAGKLGEELRSKAIGFRLAGPIFDLNPGSLDPVVKKHTERCFLRAVELASSMGADSIVFPSGFNPLLPEESVEGWRALSVETWERVGDVAERKGVEIIIKNVFDHIPDIIRKLLESLEGLPFGFCLDIGHINVYSNVACQSWLKSLEGYLREIHLHDNLGTSDDHLALGEGIIDFKSLFKQLVKKAPLPPLTFDMEKVEAAKSISYIDRLDLLGLQLDLL